MEEVCSGNYMDIFKKYDITQHYKGNVSTHMDRKLKCNLYRLSNNVPSSTYISLPSTKDSMTLYGRYFYVLFQPLPAHYFIIHIEIVTTSNHKIRLSVSNLFSQVKITSSLILLPYSFLDSGHGVVGKSSEARPTPDNSYWTVFVVDLELIVSQYYQQLKYSHISSLKVCANMLIKGCYNSDTLYQLHSTLPLDMQLPIPKGLTFNDLYQYIQFPLPPLMCQQSPCQQKETNQHLVQVCQKLNNKSIIELNKIIGNNITSNCHIVFSSLGSRTFYVAHCVIVAMETASKRQQFYIGHTDRISCITLSGDDMTLASGQFGIVRIWNVSTTECLFVFKTSHHLINCLSLSYSGNILCCVGRHSTGKTLLTIWNNNQQHIKSLTDVDVNVLRIAPFDSTRFVSCGWNNIRFWRIKANHIKSSPVNLETQRSYHFTDIQFEVGNYSNKHITDRYIYISTNNGCIFEVHYRTFSIKRVWQLFPDSDVGVSITSLALHEGYSATGSDDGILRIWPTDYEYDILETNHGTPLIAVDIAKDGLSILTATNSYIGALDVTSKTYKTILRSHSHTVNGLSTSHCNQWLATVSNDNTIRIWDIAANCQQMYEYTCEGDTPTVVKYHPITSNIIVGYISGNICCIDIITGSILSQHKNHSGSVTDIIFTSNGQKLFTCDSKGVLAVYDSTHQSYPLLKLLGNTVSGKYLTTVDDKLAYIGPFKSLITVISTTTLEQIMRYDITVNSQINELPINLCFTCNTIGHMIVLTNQNRLLKYSSVSGEFITSVSLEQNCTCFVVSDKHIITGGVVGGVAGDIKLWDYDMKSNAQTFINHTGPIDNILMSHDQLITSSNNIFQIWKFRTSKPHLLSKLTTSFDDAFHTPKGDGVQIKLATPTKQETNDNIDSQSMKRYNYNPPTYSKPSQLYLAPPTQNGIQLFYLTGFNKSGRNNIHWNQSKGVLIYTSGSIIVCYNIISCTQSLLIGHITEVATIALDHSGLGLASGSPAHNNWSSEIKIWDIETSTCTKTLNYHNIGIIALRYSLDDRFMISIGNDNILAIWECTDYTILTATELYTVVNDVQWDINTAYEFITAGNDNIQYWIFEEDTCELHVHQPQCLSHEYTTICYTNSHYVYIGCISGLVTVWNTKTNSCYIQWNTGCYDICSMYCNNNRLIVGGANGIIEAWSVDLSMSKPHPLLKGGLDVMGGVYSICFDKTLSTGIIGSDSLYCIDWTNNLSCDLLHHHHGNITDICYCTNGQFIGSCDTNGVLIIWNTTNWLPFTKFTAKHKCTAVTMINHTHQLICVCAFADGHVRVYDIISGRVLHKFKPHIKSIIKLVSSNLENTTLLCGSIDGVVIATDISRGGVTLTKISSHEGSAITDIDTKLYTTALPGIVSSNEEVWLLASEDHRISIWTNNTLLDWITIPNIHEYTDMSPPTLVRFSITELDQILFTMDSYIHIYSLTQRSVIRILSVNYWISSISLSSELIAVGSPNQVLTLMDSEGTFQECSTHCHAITSLVFSPNGDCLVTTSQNNFHIWQVL